MEKVLARRLIVLLLEGQPYILQHRAHVHAFWPHILYNQVLYVVLVHGAKWTAKGETGVGHVLDVLFAPATVGTPLGPHEAVDVLDIILIFFTKLLLAHFVILAKISLD